MFKRVMLFIATNLAVLLVLSIALQAFGIEQILDQQGVDLDLVQYGAAVRGVATAVEEFPVGGGGWVEGAVLGDGGGGHVIVEGNALVNPGQVGIGVASGTDITVTGNSVYSEALPWSNVGIYVWNQYGSACGNIQITTDVFLADPSSTVDASSQFAVRGSRSESDITSPPVPLSHE